MESVAFITGQPGLGDGGIHRYRFCFPRIPLRSTRGFNSFAQFLGCPPKTASTLNWH
ncbi:MAG: hypothetical protein HY774_29065 [Acidobacteria bacterium]|nr:hypothetical protein [Acidobacteriota bacterium]